MRKTSDPYLLLDRLVEYLGADVEKVGRGTFVVRRYAADLDPKPTKWKSEEALPGNVWDTIGKLLFVATCMEEHGGAGCTWQGIKEAVAVQFRLRCTVSGCGMAFTEDDGECPRGHSSGDLELPPSVSGNAEAQISRLYAAARADRNADRIAAALDARAAVEAP